MPQLGETVTEGTVTRWLKAEGDLVARDAALLEVSTDKVDTEIPSAYAGRLVRRLVPEGATVPIGTPIAIIETEDGGPDSEPSADSGGGTGGRHGNRASTSSASAPRGTGGDIRRTMMFGTGSTQQPVTVPAAARPNASRAPARPSSERTTGIDEPDPMRPSGQINAEVLRRVPFSTVRRLTATHLRRSLDTATHTLTSVSVDYSAVDAVRDVIGADWRKVEGFGLSYLPFVASAVCAALREFPCLNAAVDGDALAVFRSVNLGIAVDLDHEGLMVPVVPGADDLRLGRLARAIHDQATRARERSLSADDLARGTFTITNAGVHGTLLSVPVINPPQVAILATDGVRPAPVAVPLPDRGHGVAVHPVGNLALSFDHRAVDGAYSSSFLDVVRDHIEHHDWPTELIGEGSRS